MSWFADAEDCVGRCHLQILPGYKAPGHRAVLLQQRGLKHHYGAEADALAFCFASITGPSNSSTTCRAAPLSERGAARLLSELLLTLWVIYLLLGSESPAPTTLFIPALMPKLLLHFCQIRLSACRFYQHFLNKSPTMDIARFPFIASSTLCSPNALGCKNEGRMGSLHDNPGSTCWEQAGISLQPKQME